MDVTVYKPNGETVAITSAYTLDLSFGSGGNNFELTVDMENNQQLGVNWLIAIEGTEYGGVVDGRRVEVSGGETLVTWSGRTWHGVMNSHIVAPDAGKDYFSVSGDANRCLEAALKQMGLSAFFRVRSANAGVNIKYQFHRPAERGYDGVMNMLSGNNLRLMVKRYATYTEIWAEPTTTRGTQADSDVADFTAEKLWRPPNHLYCAGEGEKKERKILHLYADEKGNISQKQTLFGVDEVCEIYDYTNADDSKLLEDGTKKLKELQSFGNVDVDVTTGEEMYVGDTIVAHDRRYGQVIQDIVVKKILKVENGVSTVSYECGENTSSSGGITTAIGEWASLGSAIQTVNNQINAVNSRVDQVNANFNKMTAYVFEDKMSGSGDDVSSYLKFSNYDGVMYGRKRYKANFNKMSNESSIVWGTNPIKWYFPFSIPARKSINLTVESSIYMPSVRIVRVENDGVTFALFAYTKSALTLDLFVHFQVWCKWG